MAGPPPPPLKSSETLKPGDVVLVAKQLLDKQTGNPFWWRSFRVVLEVSKNYRHATLMILKMQPDLDKDVREIDFQDESQVITKVPEETIPQGVKAMLMKHLHTGLIRIDGALED